MKNTPRTQLLTFQLQLGLMIYSLATTAGMRMNEYGQRGMAHWRTHRPQAYQSLENPEEFFTRMGEEIATEITALAHQLAGPDLPEESYLGKVARLNNATSRATEIALESSSLYATPELTRQEWEDATEQHLEALVAWAWARQSQREGLTDQDVPDETEMSKRWLLPESVLTAMAASSSPWTTLEEPENWTLWEQSIEARWERDRNA